MENKSIEDYLKNIYTLKTSSGKVTTSHLAERLNISAAAVSEMISKLSKCGYILNTPYKGFELTGSGEKIALNLIRKHRLWEVFLVKHLKYPWDKVHEEAERLEHSSSDELMKNLEAFMNFPKFDPHGEPIPDINGNLEVCNDFQLSKSEEGKTYVIKRVSDENSEVLAYLSKIGVKLNDKVKVLEKISFDNSIQIQNKSLKLFLSEKLSNCIFVTPI
ncbi:MAG: metal-dependent transcriptional regulator [Bacteroidetes bacterium]|nr:metal-dependent transcriptional regulator [Bacteroidota bacterium]MBX7045866.1 metal-dependent transcriptional regulator [Ignavibacteria bacterium]